MKTVHFNRKAVALVLATAGVLSLFVIATIGTTDTTEDFSPRVDAVVRDIHVRRRLQNKPPVVDTGDHAGEVDEIDKARGLNEIIERANRLKAEKEGNGVKEDGREEVDTSAVVVKPPTGDGDEEDAQRREKVKQMMVHAWTGYKNYTWGANELKPVSKESHSQGIFGGAGMAATIVDAADTLYIMGLENEYNSAREFIRDNWTISKATSTLSVFETNIRFLGGMLSLYALTKEMFYVEKAKEIADALLPAFDTPSGIPKSNLNPITKYVSNYGWAAGGSSILSEFGSLHLEFAYLSNVTGNPIYYEKVKKVRDVLDAVDKPDGLYSNYMNPDTGKWTQMHMSLGALGDSFYEYLIKSWLQTGKKDDQAKKMYFEVSDAIQNKMVFKSKGGLTYVAELRNGNPEHKMGHLACFVTGMFALEAEHSDDPARKEKIMKLAEELGKTCHESYVRAASGIGPEMFYFDQFQEATTNGGDHGYIQRPEVIEGWFYLWRLTKKKVYKEWVWEAMMAIEKHCKVDAGYAGLRNVYKPEDGYDDVMQSFFFAETLKYGYLTFADDKIPLDHWVFNTEAHPLPIYSS
ncbi:hypothetical protein QR680_004245 [Steinernema hermaphroditum]|uniref:alpha-1,2-Mannosidase n=1 Tax=Steinernema hermaphroditum TaxID=289476 RepID=A0AA39HP44_9BILA|nr:hypothetical protein QR680_004245 [Steinernema hermaphroditum]